MVQTSFLQFHLLLFPGFILYVVLYFMLYSLVLERLSLNTYLPEIQFFKLAFLFAEQTIYEFHKNKRENPHSIKLMRPILLLELSFQYINYSLKIIH